MHPRHLFPVLGLAAALGAQNYTYSPAAAATAEIPDNNTIPWWSGSARYQQGHGSLRGAPRSMQATSFRRDGGGNQATAVARTIDAELFMADTNFATLSTTFASNYASTPVNTVIRKMINLPDFTISQGSPAPWNIVIPHDVPFVYTGVQDLLWEIRIHSNTNTGAYTCDAFGGFSQDVGTAATALFGTGCLATGRTSRMSITPTVYSIALTNSLRMNWIVSNATSAAPTAVILGVVGIDQPIAGLCSNLYVGGWLLTINGLSSNTGSLSTTPIELSPFDPAWVGVKLYTQAVAADAGQPVIQVAVSNRAESTIAPMPAGATDKIRRIYSSSVSATTGSWEFYNYGLVVRFTH